MRCKYLIQTHRGIYSTNLINVNPPGQSSLDSQIKETNKGQIFVGTLNGKTTKACIGGTVEVIIRVVPVGLGEPVFDKYSVAFDSTFF